MTSRDRPPRLTVSASLGLVALVAGRLAVLQRPALIASSLQFTATIWMLLGATVAARWGRYRAFWAGFSIMGWCYAASVFSPGAWMDVRPYLATSRMFASLEPDLRLTHGERSYEPGVRRVPPDVGYHSRSSLSPELSRFTTESQENFQRVGHSIVAILLGVSGGIAAFLLASRVRPGSGPGAGA